MLAMRVHDLGGALVADQVAPPYPGPGQVRLAVLAAGVNFADTLMVKGQYQERPALPFAPGIEVCGVVEARGPGVAAPPLGARVVAVCGHGGFAQAVLAPAAACVAVPEAVGDAVAAALQVAYGTSHLALDHRARLRPGERLLVTGAAGGVGLTAVEIGALMGAEVIAVARGADRLALAAAKGARHLIDSDAPDLRDAVRALGGADVVYDPVGGPVWEAAIRSANPEARLIPIGFASGTVPQIPANILLVKNLTVIGLYWGGYARFRPDILGASTARLLDWAATGRIVPHVSHTLPLAEANAALALLADRTATGKVVLVP